MAYSPPSLTRGTDARGQKSITQFGRHAAESASGASFLGSLSLRATRGSRRMEAKGTGGHCSRLAGTARKDAQPLTVQSLPDNNEVLSPPGNRCYRGPFFCAAGKAHPQRQQGGTNRTSILKSPRVCACASAWCLTLARLKWPVPRKCNALQKSLPMIFCKRTPNVGGFSWR